MPDLRDRVIALEEQTGGKWERQTREDGTVIARLVLPDGNRIAAPGPTTADAHAKLETRVAAFLAATADEATP